MVMLSKLLEKDMKIKYFKFYEKMIKYIIHNVFARPANYDSIRIMMLKRIFVI